jgi:hypothetical protein
MDDGEQRLPKLTLEAQEHRLSATFTPGAGVVPPTQEQVQQLLQQQGYGNWHVEQKALQAFINSCRQATHAISADIGEQRDAEFIFNISSDKLSLYLTLLPAEGGEPIGDKGGAGADAARHSARHSAQRTGCRTRQRPM